ncbi:MAG: HIT domain-containing protein [Acidimicrobiales bacterium]|jgi:histidine triad (HIT) family protein
MTDCLFCRIVAGDIPSDRVHETETTVAFKDINPAAPLHVLVVPRRHIEDAAAVTAEDGPVLADMLVTARAVAEAAGVAVPDRGYRLVLNVGPDAMNSVPHLHLHVLGGEPLKGHFASA